MGYVPLHVHSVYSNHESLITVNELVSRAAYLGFGAIALTDHWSTYGHHELHDLAKRAGIKPIFGAEIRHSSLTGAVGMYHLTLLAENETGYRNLVSLVSAHSGNGREPHVTPDELAGRRSGLIALSGCVRGETGQAIVHGTLGRAASALERLVEIFGRSNVFAEIMNHDTEQEMLVMDQLAILAKKQGIPLVATNNDRYLLKDDAGHYRILQSLHAKQAEGERAPATEEYYLKKERDLVPFFYGEAEPLERSGEIAERCSVDLGAPGRVRFSMMANPDEWLTNVCRRRFLLTFHNRPHDERVYLRGVMTRELDVARAQGVCDFLVFVRELLFAAAKRGVWVELAGSELLTSLVAHLLEIVPLNPIDHDLVFESFTERSGAPPALEIIVSERKKGFFIEMLGELLPGYRPCYELLQEEMSIATIAKEVGELLKAPQELREAMGRSLAYERSSRTLSALLETSEPMQRLCTSEPLAREILQSAFALHGKVLHVTQDRSRIVVLPPRLEELAAFSTDEDGERFVQLPAPVIEERGGWSMGVQHSHSLTAVSRAVAEMRRMEGDGGGPSLFTVTENGRWAPGALDDPATYALISSGDTTGVYLLESQGIRDHLEKTRPAVFNELVNVISLYRPGPLEGGLWQRYLDNAEKKGKVYLPHHSLASALETTRGVLLYREQVREILEQTAGLTGVRALGVERALQDRDAGELVNARLAYIRGAMDAGIDEEDAQKNFDFLLHNVGFTHSKALSVTQAYLSYRTAFLKAHAFDVFFLALLNSNLDVSEREEKYRSYMRSKGTTILLVSVNASAAEYSFEEGRLRPPLRSVASLERHEWEAIIKERGEHGVFPSFDDFLARMAGRVSEEAIMELVSAGGFDETGIGREELGDRAREAFENRMRQGFYPPVAARAPAARKKREAKRQMNLFDAEGGGKQDAG